MAPLVWHNEWRWEEATDPAPISAEVAALIGEALSTRRGPSMVSGEPDRWSPDTTEERDE